MRYFTNHGSALETRAEGPTLSPAFVEQILGKPACEVQIEATRERDTRLLTIDHMLARISFDLAKLKRLEKQLTEERAVLEGGSRG